jgi:N-acetyl-gamma-glutamyl-phosphate/LysW-gamma-L-alpha-aminoadipyl-6-phosphate reductase
MQGTASRPRVRAAIIGGTGYGGAELIRLLIAHPGVELVRVTSIDHVGEPLEAVHRNLGRPACVFEKMEPAAAAEGVDVVFLALPHKVSATLGEALAGVSAKIIDLSGDFRLRDAADYKTFYGDDAPAPEPPRRQLGLRPARAQQARRSAARTGSPRRAASPPRSPSACCRWPARACCAGRCTRSAITGSSGSGAYASLGTHHPLRANNLKTYKVLNHQHTRRSSRRCAILRPPATAGFSLAFVPVSAPLVRGILANSFVPLPAASTPGRRAVREFYKDAPFVRVLGSKVQAEVVAVKGSMFVDLSWTLGRPRTAPASWS